MERSGELSLFPSLLGGEKFRPGWAREFLLRFSGQRRVQYGRERKRTEPKMAAMFLVVNKDGGSEGKRDERDEEKAETVSLEKGGCWLYWNMMEMEKF